MTGYGVQSDKVLETRRDKEGYLLVRSKCSCCKQCWIYLTGPGAGQCIYGGPFGGYEKQITENDSVSPVQEDGKG